MCIFEEEDSWGFKPCIWFGNHKLCIRCLVAFENINRRYQMSAQVNFKHHQSHGDLIKAAAFGCAVCLLLVERLKHLELKLQDTSNNQSICTINLNIDGGYTTLAAFLHIRNASGHVVGTLTFDIKDVEHGPGGTNCPDECHSLRWECSTRSDNNLAQIRAWLADCRNSHSQCSRQETDQRLLPSRLVRIQRYGDDIRAHLVCGRSIPVSSQYLTLSHCWGNAPIFGLETSNITDLEKDICLAALPKVFQDAMWLTERLSFNYLWIDSLCIIQDSKEDWKQEVSRMGNIYRNCVCNLAATGFADGSQGLFVSRAKRAISPPFFIGNYGKHCLLIHRELWSQEVDEAPLNQRAWVFQERALSPRIIHFGNKQIFWECGTQISSEAFRSYYCFDWQHNSKSELRQHLTGTERAEDTCRLWRSTVEVYSGLQMTYGRDKIPALATIANEFQSTNKDEYLFGLWRRSLFDDLLWHVPESCNSVELPVEQRAPSWSWCCLDARVWYPASTPLESHMQLDHYLTELIDCDLPQYFGDIAWTPMNSRLRLRGYLVEGTLRRAPPDNDHDSLNQTSSNNDWKLQCSGHDMNIRFYPDVGELCCSTHAAATISNTELSNVQRIPILTGRSVELTDNKPRSFLPILSRYPRDSAYQERVRWLLYGLVLCPERHNPGEYHRAGLFLAETVYPEEFVADTGALKREITIR